MHVAYGYGLFTGGLGAHYGAERLGCTVVPMSGGQTEKQVQLIVDFEPDVIMVTPSYMLNIAEEFVRQGLDPRRAVAQDRHLRRRAVDRGDARRHRSAHGPRRGRPLRAVGSHRTRRRRRVHREQGRPGRLGGPLLPRDHRSRHAAPCCADGELGELVFTSLTKEALPIIRYRTRDLTTLLPPTSRSMRRMAKVTGRTDDMLIIRGVNVFPSQIEELILQQRGLAPHYVLEISRDGTLDELTVKVEPDEGAASERATSDRAAANLRLAVKTFIGVSATVIVNDPGTIERSIGKAKRVIDTRAQSR